MQHKELKTILSNNFVKFSLLPIFIIEVALLVLYFATNSLILEKNTTILLENSKIYSNTILKNEANTINQTLSNISKLATILQKEHANLFKYKTLNINRSLAQFNIAENGVFYKTNKDGSSLYYSSKTPIGQEEKNKAIFTENMDLTFKSIVDTNPMITAAYFNSYDNMNRLYPYIDKVYEQYGKHIHMEDYNFYYLADKKHNPDKKPVWTGAYLDPAGKGWMLSCIVPIYNNGFLEGVSGLDITIDTFVKNMLNTKLHYDAKIFMVDKEGMILAMPKSIEELLNLKELKSHSYSNAITQTVNKPKKFNLFKNKNPFAIQLKKLLQNNINTVNFDIKEKKYVALQQTVPTADWKLIILVERNKVFSSITKLKNIANKIGYFAILFLIIFSFLLLYYLLKQSSKVSKTIVGPILNLATQTKHIETLNLDSNLLDTEISEIHQLNTNFLRMASELNKKSKKIIAKELALLKSNETLELKVKERTIQIEEKNKQLKVLAQTDYLTGLYNRAKINEVLNYELKYSKRYHTIFGVMMIDIDLFKQINDNYGHQLGDTVLCEFANLLKENSRETDTVGRWGGEEFFIIVENVDKDAILKLAEILRVVISNYAFSIIKYKTASFGVSIYQSNDDINTIVSRADAALYKAKKHGKNRVEFL
ncbi:MAG: peptidase C56 [Sulfurovum sp.]|nr:MAG: peptidase C56 [Sulfurovum sp.]